MLNMAVKVRGRSMGTGHTGPSGQAAQGHVDAGS